MTPEEQEEFLKANPEVQQVINILEPEHRVEAYADLGRIKQLLDLRDVLQEDVESDDDEMHPGNILGLSVAGLEVTAAVLGAAVAEGCITNPEMGPELVGPTAMLIGMCLGAQYHRRYIRDLP